MPRITPAILPAARTAARLQAFELRHAGAQRRGCAVHADLPGSPGAGRRVMDAAVWRRGGRGSRVPPRPLLIAGIARARSIPSYGGSKPVRTFFPRAVCSKALFFLIS